MAIDEVREYYDANTRSFLRFGQGRGTDTIRRAIWGPGVATREEAFHFVDAEIAKGLELGARRGTRIVDLGCGVGGSLFWLAERFDVDATGVTLSQVQAAIANERLRARQLRGKVQVVAGDFHEVTLREPQDAAFAIESFVHVPDLAVFFRRVKRLLAASGRLIVIDDFLARSEPLGPSERTVVDSFRRGWRVSTLVTVDEATRAAKEAGFEPAGNVDLTRYLELGRPRDIFIRGFVRTLGLVGASGLVERPRFANLVGGDALQRGLRTGLFEHRMVSFHA
jgi:cyclopropane fatty-acyl-phospholipid synthase-like methyltransferase